MPPPIVSASSTTEPWQAHCSDSEALRGRRRAKIAFRSAAEFSFDKKLRKSRVAFVGIAPRQHEFDIARQFDSPCTTAVVRELAPAQFEIVAWIDADRRPAFEIAVNSRNLGGARRHAESRIRPASPGWAENRPTRPLHHPDRARKYESRRRRMSGRAPSAITASPRHSENPLPTPFN